MPTFKITVAYDGAPFVGWQRQTTGPSVQGLIEDILRNLEDGDVTVHGAGRTDAGVHALGQVASFTLRRAVAADVVQRALNASLPDEVRVVAAAEVPASFHARFAARSKTYRYRVWNSDVSDPFERNYAWHVRGALGLEAMAEAARSLEGRHDFAAFQAAEGAHPMTVREIFLSRLTVDAAGQAGALPLPGQLLVYEIAGSGFLRYMVRAIVGSLMEIGHGRRNVAWMQDVMASRDRTRAGPTAPAHGLFLVRVDYPGPDAD
jgi:tRNA pseudouridine38-40 synthase